MDWLNTKLKYIQFGEYEGKLYICGYDDKGELVYCDDCNCCNMNCKEDRLGQPICKIDKNKLILKGEKIEVNNMKCADMRKCVHKVKKHSNNLNDKGINQKELISEVKSKDSKIQYKQSGAIEAAMFGNAVGHFLANWGQFKNADNYGKMLIIGNSSIPLGFLLAKKLINITPVVKDTAFDSLFKYGFFALSLFEICRSLCSIIISESIDTKEKLIIFGKKLLGLGSDVLFGYLGTAAGMEIVLALGITFVPGQIIISGLTSAVFGYIGGKINQYFNEDKNKKLIFYSDSLYFQYIPKKYRELMVPTLKWENPPLKARSYAIELIVNEDGKNPSWLVINIPGKIKEFNEDSKDGKTIINYKGVPENAFCGCFILYVFNIDEIDERKFFAIKNGLREGKDLSKRLIEYKILAIS